LDWYEKTKKEQINQIIKQSKKEKLGIEDYEITLKDENLKSSDIYQSLKKFFGKKTESGHTIIRGSEKEVSQFLDRAGIHGIRYPTESLSGGRAMSVPDISTLTEPQQNKLLKRINELGYDLKDIEEMKSIEFLDYQNSKFRSFKKIAMRDLGYYKQKSNYVIFNEKAVEIVPNNP